MPAPKLKGLIGLMLSSLLLGACSARPSQSAGPEGSNLEMELRSNGFRLLATGGMLKFVQLSDQRVRYHPNPELAFSPTGQVVSAADNALMLDPSISAAGFQRQTLNVCSDGIVTIRDESGRLIKIGRILLTRFAEPAQLLAHENGFFEATAAAGTPQTFAPLGEGQTCQ
ncbi:MAG: hypothetical protein CVV27_18510 [Candidatus Melainabacteria bacterium HGW-Melainabacteria-1]|nr:MAG: hypothetical protein CVV27_18510 [Candidatus Melainabacteria bacterium HGW-Melainabacteria-1]